MAGDLFENALEDRFDEFAPLAARMRPTTLDELVGQEHVLGAGGPLRSLIEADRLTSLILWGPPGSGKTSLARVISNVTRSHFVEISAVGAGVAEVRKAIAEAKERLGATGVKTLLFIDEIHRFNKAQQDALLKAVENSWVVLIGATTENPFFEVVSPLLSRSLLFQLHALGPADIEQIVRRAMTDPKRGLGSSQVTISDEAVKAIVDRAGGDARFALNALEVTVASTLARGAAEADAATVEEVLQRRVVRYDKGGDQHYDVISAFIKSMRGTDPDAAVWWLTQMIESGEDPRFIARRMVIFASEDVGNADPSALQVAVAAFQALEYVGLPEAAFNLCQAATYLASAPKSNAIKVALGRARSDLKTKGSGQVPLHLRDASHPGVQALGHGEGYLYPHDFPGGWVAQRYLPEHLGEPRYYEPSDRGAEAGIRSRLDERDR